MVPLKGGTNKINAAYRPQAYLFSVFLPKLAQRRTIKVGGGVKISGAIIRAVLLTHSGFNGRTKKNRHAQLDWASFKSI